MNYFFAQCHKKRFFCFLQLGGRGKTTENFTTEYIVCSALNQESGHVSAESLSIQFLMGLKIPSVRVCKGCSVLSKG